jgi:hypothetical protein
MENLTAVSQKLGEAVYAQGGAPAGTAPEAEPRPNPAGGEGKKKDEDVIDAEFEVKE